MTQDFDCQNYFDVQLWAESVPPLLVEDNVPQTFEHFWWPGCERILTQQSIDTETSTGINGLISVLAEHNATKPSPTDESSSALENQPGESRRDKRLRQNRAAQRAFRQRRESRMSELLDEVSTVNAKMQDLEIENKQLTDSLRDAQTEIRSLRSLVPEKLASQCSERYRSISVSQEQANGVVTLKFDLSQLRRSTELDAEQGIAPATS